MKQEMIVHMLCPIDQTTLVMTERQGVEIDYCPTCRGVWLDRGELDKVIERAHTESASPARYRDDDDRDDDRTDRQSYRPRQGQGGMLGKVSQALGQRGDNDDRDDRDDTRYDQHGRPRRKKKESFLDDLFDF
jgi:Zn-finger nucleic acid-binding protein